MEELEDYFVSIIDQSSSADMAEAEFRRSLVDDENLRRRYKAYCKEIGTSEKNGFMDFCEEYLSGRNEMWNSLDDYDNHE